MDWKKEHEAISGAVVRIIAKGSNYHIKFRHVRILAEI